MRREITFKNRDRFIRLGIAISTLRKIRGMSQEELAEKANISRSMLALIESPNLVQSLSIDILFSIADALNVTAAELLSANLFSEDTINNSKL